MPDVNHPTSGQWLTIFLKQSAGTSPNRQNGNRVKKIRAASILCILKIFRNRSLSETVHFINHPDGRFDDRISADRSGAFP